MRGLTRWQKNATAFFGIAFLTLAILQPVMVGNGMALAAVNTTAEEAHMLQLVNQARNSAGLPSLYAEQQLTDMARSYVTMYLDPQDFKDERSAHSAWYGVGFNVYEKKPPNPASTTYHLYAYFYGGSYTTLELTDGTKTYTVNC